MNEDVERLERRRSGGRTQGRRTVGTGTAPCDLPDRRRISGRRQPARLALVSALLAAALLGGACSGGPERTNWALRRAPEGEVLDLAVAVGSSSCNRFEGFEVEESETEVRVVARWSRTGGDCTSDLQVRSEQVRLASPLGDRELTGCIGTPQAPDPWEPVSDCRDVRPGL